jgi:hypothetical protein
MKLLTNGCSFTQGEYDNFNEQDAWPYQLADKLGWEVDNIAKGGGSNARIFRTTMEHLLDNSPDHVVIAWTQTDRYELPYHTGDTIRIMHGMASPEIDEAITDIPELREFWYRHCDNNIAGLARTVYYIRSLIMVLRARMIPYTMCWGMQCDYITQIQQPGHPMCNDFPKDRVSQLANEIDKMQDVPCWFKWGSSMEKYLEDYPKADKQGHPGIEGQTEWANQLYRKINEAVCITC